jgi:hypothetical protein
LENRALGAASGISDPGQRAVAVHNYVESDPFARTMSDLYATSGILFVSAAVVVEYINRREAAHEPDTDQVPVLHRIAGTVRTTKEGARAIRDAWRGNALPQPPQVALAKGTVESAPRLVAQPTPDQEVDSQSRPKAN